MPDHRSNIQKRPLPLMGFLSLMAGGGMFYTAQRLTQDSTESTPWLRQGCTLIGLGLMLWGVILITSRMGSPPASAHVGRLNRNRVMLPREGMFYLLIMIISFVASMIGRSNMLMLVFSIMAGPFIVNGWVTFSLLKRNRISRRLPDRIMAGETASIEITLENRKRWLASWLMLVRDRVSRDGARQSASDGTVVLEPSVLFASVPRQSTRTACYQLRLNRRGRYIFGPLEFSTRFPLGLVERGYVTSLTGSLLVHPRLGWLTPRWNQDAQLAAELSQRPFSRRGMFEDEFHHLRDYRPGDSPRDIHWRTSARRNGLMVRQFHQSRDRNLIMLIDLWQPDRPGADHIDRVELALSFAATVCVDHLHQARGVDQTVLVAGQTVQRHHSGITGSAMDAVLDLLALAEAGRADGIREILDQTRSSATAMTRIVLVTTRSAGAAEAAGITRDAVPGLELYEAVPEQLGAFFSLETPDGHIPGLTAAPEWSEVPA